MYAEMQMQLIERIPEIREKVNYQGRVQLGIMFQVPTDKVLRPEFIQRMQSTYAEREQMEEQNMSTPGQIGAPGGLTEAPTQAQKLACK